MKKNPQNIVDHVEITIFYRDKSIETIKTGDTRVAKQFADAIHAILTGPTKEIAPLGCSPYDLGAVVRELERKGK